MLPFELPGRRHLRLLDEADATELHALIAANRSYLARWMPWAEGQTPAQTLAFIRTTRKQAADNDGFQAAIVEGQRIIGIVGFHSVDWSSAATRIGYWLSEAEQGQGTMTEAVRALVDHALSEWRLNRVEIHADVENLHSRAIPERLGFRRESRSRQDGPASGGERDEVMYLMLAADWRNTAHGRASA